MEERLDREFPQGDPQSPICRWCHGPKVIRHGEWRICYRCDEMKRR